MTKEKKTYNKTDLAKKLAGIEEKFGENDYILLGFETTTAVGDEVVKAEDIGILNLNTAIDYASIFKELVVKDRTHKVLGGNFPSLKKSDCPMHIREAASMIESYNIPEQPVKKKPAKKKTEDKLAEAKERLAKSE